MHPVVNGRQHRVYICGSNEACSTKESVEEYMIDEAPRPRLSTKNKWVAQRVMRTTRHMEHGRADQMHSGETVPSEQLTVVDGY